VSQRPLELILARNLLSGLSTPAFLVDEEGVLVFYNDAAGALLGKRFEEAGKMRPDEWGTAFGPVDAGGKKIAIEELPLTLALRRGRPAHARFQIRSLDGREHDIEVSAVPIVTTEGTSGSTPTTSAGATRGCPTRSPSLAARSPSDCCSSTTIRSTRTTSSTCCMAQRPGFGASSAGGRSRWRWRPSGGSFGWSGRPSARRDEGDCRS
jgi:hypothetical protein